MHTVKWKYIYLLSTVGVKSGTQKEILVKKLVALLLGIMENAKWNTFAGKPDFKYMNKILLDLNYKRD